jgi:Transcription initiation factor TFIID, subunit TAF1
VEYLHIDDADGFNEIFGLAAVMHITPEVVDADLFKYNTVLAVIRDGLWNLRADYVADKPDGLEFHYRAEALPATYKAVTPLIISVPKSSAHSYKFVEDGTLTHVIAADDPENAQERFPNVSVAGGWSRKMPVDPESRAVFDRAMVGHTGSRFEPVYYSSQVTNGRNYRFYCLQTMVTDPPKHGLATVSFHVAPGGEVSGLEIAGAGK